MKLGHHGGRAMRSFGRFAVFLAAFSCSANATILLEDNFDNEAPGVSSLNYDQFANFTVVEGSVNLVHSGDETYQGIMECTGQTGGCVDLAGYLTSAGTLRTATFQFLPGYRYTLSFDLSGSQRQFGPHDWFASLVLNAPVDATVYLNSSNGLARTNITRVSVEGERGTLDWFETVTLAFQSESAGQFYAEIGSGSYDGQGPVLDNVLLTETPVVAGAVPEPSTWALLTIGIGIIGRAMRKRSKREPGTRTVPGGITA